MAVAGIRAAASLLPADPFFGRSFQDLNGEDFPLSTLVGRPVLANFWASWCPPCVREMPDLDALHREHPGVAFVGLAVDTRANVERFVQKVPVSYPVLLTGTQGIPLMRELGNKGGGLPFTALFDARGRSAGVILGEVDPADIRRRIAEIL
ncbi:TlpA disulfide reductase family protein [Castellaniella sp. GW247-6E4]|uniref:TlpA family protein disulfide reductase n=1 Tax=Castellaniella sp. GW247-6E4 TaxID=3140380 RepID=UPI003315CFC7